MSSTASRAEPTIIQGGMGVAVSAWQLARAVSKTGQLGVISGTALDAVMVRRLQLGDEGGHLRRAMAEFPYPEMADRILKKYFVEGGKADGEPLVGTMVIPMEPTQEQLELVVVANFVEVYLAKEGHDGIVGVNFLEKIQLPTLPSIFGAMLAGVDYVLMGAGIPKAIPGILDRLSEGKAVELPIYIIGAERDDNFVTRFDPVQFTNGELPWLHRPKFLAIVASATLANMLAKKASGYVDGFIVEGPTAGGHNAPPRGPKQTNDRGEPLYGKRDVVDLNAIAALGRPFWLAGSYGSPDQVMRALESGATGVQVGTAFAFCEESGFSGDIKDVVFNMVKAGEVDVKTDAEASPTGFPFKVLQIEGTMSDEKVYKARTRVCDLGFLREGYRKPDGSVGWRCPSEKIAAFTYKGGDADDTVGRKCVCNGLMTNVGLGQRRKNGEDELPLVTCGNDVAGIKGFMKTAGSTSYSAADVVERLMSNVIVPAVAAH
ncbi:nitronate monooxygenase [Novipirellula artificiosorum]|uniref:Nitronate monooxygenase n=1 Tax=Novipirellula artificiosorum TaxID=2528016 RepID=A0A5C6DW32_9BACT|nr:nitronate monooxygenase [Novipirellula artificiosorum]TWU39266.1 Nitronate monooxygenase [Novipirellula artificiosorum]